MGNKKLYQRTAAIYDFLDFPFERFRYRKIRPEMFAGASGAILDAGTGTGCNIAFYPRDSEVTGIDLSPAMLKKAERKRQKLGRTMTLMEMDVLDMTFADHSFDHIVATFLFCVLEEDRQLAALKELRRVCRAQGEIRILEYTLSADPIRRWIMELWAPWVRLVYGAGFDRDTERYIAQAGLELVSRRFVFKDVLKLLVLRPKAGGR